MSNAQLNDGERGGFVALAVLAAAAGAGAALLLAPDAGARTRRRVGQLERQLRRRKHRSRREHRTFALAGLLVGAGLTALLTPESGPATRRLLGGTISRIRVGAVDRIERLRQAGTSAPADETVRSVQELGRDPNDVF
jgi:gas vesicle protein